MHWVTCFQALIIILSPGLTCSTRNHSVRPRPLPLQACLLPQLNYFTNVSKRRSRWNSAKRQGRKKQIAPWIKLSASIILFFSVIPSLSHPSPSLMLLLTKPLPKMPLSLSETQPSPSAAKKWLHFHTDKNVLLLMKGSLKLEVICLISNHRSLRQGSLCLPCRARSVPFLKYYLLSSNGTTNSSYYCGREIRSIRVPLSAKFAVLTPRLTCWGKSDSTSNLCCLWRSQSRR